MQNGGIASPLDILEALGDQAATSYYEGRIAAVIRRFLDEGSIPYRTDDYGNVIAHVQAHRSLNGPPIALIAHMDHPGFELMPEGYRRQGRARAQMLGRTHDAVYAQQVPLLVYSADGAIMHARTTGDNSDPERRRLDIAVDAPPPLPAFAVFDLPGFARDAELIRMRACDDLAGCAAVLSVLQRLVHVGAPTDVYGVFTRAEEEGLLGARLIAGERRLPLDTLIVSVESSRSLPGAEHGKGPIIRVGDAAATFSYEAESLLLTARQRLSQRTPPVPVQRQLMSGGVCEASAFLLHGYRATGMAFPLGHYHNGLGEDEGVQAEFIDVRDFLGGVELLHEAALAAPAGATSVAVYTRVRTRPEPEAERLRQTSAS